MKKKKIDVIDCTMLLVREKKEERHKVDRIAMATSRQVDKFTRRLKLKLNYFFFFIYN